MPSAPGAFERFEFRDFNGRIACCQLELLRLADGRSAAIATELADNSGMSITNPVEIVATNVCRQFCIDPYELIWIEHYDTDSYHGGGRGESFERVAFVHITPTADVIFASPSWKRMITQDWLYLGLQPLMSNR